MRRSIATYPLTIAMIALGLTAAPVAMASSEDERPGEIGVLAGAGWGDRDLVGNHDSHGNGLAGARFAWHFSDTLTGYVDGTWVKYSGDKALWGDVSEYALRVGPEWYLNPASRFQVFVNLGLGAMDLKPDFGGDGGRGFVSVGLGARQAWRVGALRMEIRGDRTVASADRLGATDVSSFKALLGWTFGVGPRPKDTDGDGVYDKKDKCKDTPHGALVDAVGCPSDTDGDGVWDGLDQCPDTPKGWPVDARGCPLDSDGDGVADGKDTCPGTPKGCTVDKAGCPVDADGDGVCDGVDACPDTPRGCKVDARGCHLDADGDKVCDGLDACPGTPAGVQVDAKGCPPPAPPPAPAFIPEAKKELVLERVFFETDSAKLKPESAETLDRVAASLKDFPGVKLQVAGHTDDRGSVAHNDRLSSARASAVMNYLISKGVSPSMLTAKGYGESEPLADNKTAEGRSKNRRVGLRRID